MGNPRPTETSLGTYSLAGTAEALETWQQTQEARVALAGLTVGTGTYRLYYRWGCGHTYSCLTLYVKEVFAQISPN